jgi:hypothetical protein
MLSALATLGLPTPVVAKTRMERKTTIEQAIASTSGSDEDEKEVRAAVQGILTLHVSNCGGAPPSDGGMSSVACQAPTPGIYIY